MRRPILVFGAFLDVDYSRRGVVAEFLLEGFYLLIYNVIALILVEFLLYALGYIYLEFYLLLLLAEKLEEFGSAFFYGIYCEQLRLVSAADFGMAAMRLIISAGDSMSVNANIASACAPNCAKILLAVSLMDEIIA